MPSAGRDCRNGCHCRSRTNTHRRTSVCVMSSQGRELIEKEAVEKFKFIVSQLSMCSPWRSDVESMFVEFEEQEEMPLVTLIDRTNDLLNMEGTADILHSTGTQAMLNKILDKFDTLLPEVIANLVDMDRFRSFKSDLRQLFNYLEKRISTLEENGRRQEELRSKLQPAEEDMIVIRIGNIAAQLRNKLIRFVKPDLSERAARDQNFSLLLAEPRYASLSELIRTHTSNLNIADVDRAVTALLKERVQKAHSEQPLSAQQLDMALAEYVKLTDPYLAQQATLVVKFLKIFAETLHEPLIVDMS